MRSKRVFAAIGALGLAILTGCSSGGGQSEDTGKLMAEAAAIKEADLERYANRATDLEFPLYMSLLKESGLEAELGGPEAAKASLHALMADLRRKSMGTRADLPRLIKADLGEESGYGFTGLGASTMIGGMLGLFGSQLESGMKASHADKQGSMDLKVTDGGIASQSEFDGVVGDGLTGKISTTVNYDMCPDAEGRIHVTFKSKSALSKVGGKAGANLSVSVEGNLYYNDDARITNEWDADIRIEHAAFNGTGKGSYIDASWKIGKENASGTINRASSQATEADAKIVAGQQQFAQLMAMMILHAGKDQLEKGRCVTLNATATPAKRNRVAPSTAFSVLAKPRSKLDGQPAGGTVTAALEGEGKLDPVGTKVPADATFSYIAPADKQKRGLVKMESRSKRGVGRAELDFDTMANAFFAEGGLDAYHGTGTICDFSQPFEISGSGVVNKFTPSGPTSGSYSYSGSIAGFSVWGKGTYSVRLNEDGSGGTMLATGPGSVRTPMGVRTGQGTEKYTLRPAEPCK